MSKYSIDYSANSIVGTTTNAKCDQTDGRQMVKITLIMASHLILIMVSHFIFHKLNP